MIIRAPYFHLVLRKSLFLFFGFAVLFLIGWCSSPAGKEFFVRLFWLYVFCIPLYGVFANAGSTDIILFKSTACIYYGALISLITILYTSISGGIKGIYNMALGYSLLYPTLLLALLIKEKKSCFNCMIFLLNMFVIVAYGSRGQLACIGAFFIFGFLGRKRNITGRRLICFITMMAFSIVVFMNLKNVLLFFSDAFRAFNIQSRTLEYLIERPMYTGREVVWREAIDKIYEKPWFGWTVGLDYSFHGVHPHQFILELLLHYGCIIGGAISLYITFLIIKKIVICNRQDNLTLIMFGYGLIPLLRTSEYLMWPSFWAFIALCGRRKQRSEARKLPICLMKNVE